MGQIAMIAALYAAITFAAFFLSFGSVQLRVSEMLTVLPAFTGAAVPGLTLGCVVANLVGFFTGVNPLGWIDAIVGTAATLLAAVSSRLIGKSRHTWVRYVFVPLPPVLFNMVLVGGELMVLFGPVSLAGFGIHAFLVGIGQVIACYGLGLPLMMVLSRNDFYKRIFSCNIF